ncbi:MAG: hypothetical protein RR458_05075, partial [Clostridia bacterium]
GHNLEYDASWATYGNSLYEAAKYVYNLDFVDKTKIAVSGHSMGGMATNSALDLDNKAKTDENLAKGFGLNILAAGLVQANNASNASYGSYLTAIGNLKATDDEFFYASKLADGKPSIARQYLQSQAAAQFIGIKDYGNSINIENKAFYIDGKKVDAGVNGQAIKGGQIRTIMEAKEIHPLNHFSTASTNNLVNFFYNIFGTPTGASYIAPNKQIWQLKEVFATLGLIGFFIMIFPLVELFLQSKAFGSLRGVAKAKDDLPVLLTSPRRHVSYWVPAIASTLFAGFSIAPATNIWVKSFAGLFKNQYLPQDTTGTVAFWSICCGLFALAVTWLVWAINQNINLFKAKGEEPKYDDSLFAVAKISSFKNAFKTVVVVGLIITILYSVLQLVWGLFTVDFRFWTFDVRIFDPIKLPMMLRYSVFFFIYYAINGILNQSYRVKDLPDWATTAINAFFTVFGIVLVIAIQYITFTSTGVLWDPATKLTYIVLFPIVPVLIVATVISRKLYKKTGNIWMGSLINAVLFTFMTCANTSFSGFPILWFMA